MTDTKEGWGVIRPGDRRAHYYRDMTALCRRVGFYTGPLDPDEFPSKDDCAACRKVLSKERAAPVVAPPRCDKALDTASEVCPACGRQHTEV